MIQYRSLLKGIAVVITLLVFQEGLAQQDPQYTQYMYNTISVNPAYAGQRDVLSITGLFRSQWVGIDGAPQTQTLSAHGPLRNDALGLGASVVNDQLGPATETFFDGNFSYTIPLNRKSTELSFGLKAGLHILRTDWSKGNFQYAGDAVYQDNINLTSPVIGAGVYLHADSWYLGVSVPSFLTTEHYSDIKLSTASERLHYYFIGGLVLNLSNTVKFKPAFLVKAVSGAPLIADVSGNFLFNDKLTLGLAWRWDDSIAALAGFQITPGMYIGYSYDATTTELKNYNSGTHEIMLRFELQRAGRIISPRFF